MHPALKSFTLGIVASTLAIAGCAVPTHLASVPATSVSARTASLGLRLHWGRQVQWVATDVTKVHLDIQVEGTTYHTQMDVTSTSDLVDVSGLPGGVASVTATAYVGSTAVGTSNGTIPLVLGARGYADLSITLDSAGTAALLLQTPLDATRLAPQPSNQAPGATMYVMNGLGKTLDAVDLRTRTVTPAILTTGLYPNQLLTVGATTYLVNSGDGEIDLLDLPAHTKLGSISLPAGSNPMTLAMLGSSEALVVNYLTQDVAWIDLSAKSLEATVSVGPGAPFGGVAIANGKAYVSTAEADYSNYPYIAYTSSSLMVLDLLNHTVLRTIALQNDDNPYDVSLDPAGHLEVAVKDGILVVDPETDTVLRRITFGAHVSSIRYLSATRAYAAAAGGMVSFNPTTGEILRGTDHLIASGGGDFKIFGNAAYVCNFAEDSIRVIDLATETASDSDIVVGDGPFDLTFVTATP